MGLVVFIVSIVEKIDYLMMVAHSNQSGTKPNLVAKIWLPSQVQMNIF